MKVELEYGKLPKAVDFLYSLKLTRKDSRFRRRLINIMNERLKTVDLEREEILKEHSNKDEKGEAIIKDGNYDVKDMVALSNDLKELYAEKLVLEGGDNRELIRTIAQALKKFENEEYEGQTSEIYDYLCEQFGPSN